MPLGACRYGLCAVTRTFVFAPTNECTHTWPSQEREPHLTHCLSRQTPSIGRRVGSNKIPSVTRVASKQKRKEVICTYDVPSDEEPNPTHPRTPTTPMPPYPNPALHPRGISRPPPHTYTQPSNPPSTPLAPPPSPHLPDSPPPAPHTCWAGRGTGKVGRGRGG
jgi:hypothetical protein